MPVGTMALVAAALFTGAAFYISYAEHPARMSLPTAQALHQWKPAYERGFRMQIVLVIVSALGGVLAALFAGDWRWLLGALLIAANVPYTLFAIMPTNTALEAASLAEADASARERLETWGRLHTNRTILGALAVLAYCWAL
jgi:hypothetical protein